MNLIGKICQLFLCLAMCSICCSVLAAQEAQTPPPAAAPQAVPIAAEPESIERMLSITVFDWIPSGGPKLRQGSQAIVPPSHDLTLPTRPSRAYGAMITIPMKGWTRLELSYLRVYDQGSGPAPTDIGLFGGTIPKDEPLDMRYSLSHIKASWNFLTYPNPPLDAKFRIKTLWEFHYMQIKPTVTATVTAPDLPLIATQKIYLPAVGLGFEYVPSKHFRMEVRGSGMAFPGHSMIADAEGTAVVRMGSLEVFAGGKYLQFKTSPKQETFIKGTLWGPVGGVRWVFK